VSLQLKTRIGNSLRESVNTFLNFFSYPIQPKTLIGYEEYQAWKARYYAQHKDHYVEAAEALGRAFCQDHNLRDMELENSENRIYSETLILSRYVNRHRVLN
jgi:hypothetical protein